MIATIERLYFFEPHHVKSTKKKSLCHVGLREDFKTQSIQANIVISNDWEWWVESLSWLKTPLHRTWYLQVPHRWSLKEWAETLDEDEFLWRRYHTVWSYCRLATQILQQRQGTETEWLEAEDLSGILWPTWISVLLEKN